MSVGLSKSSGESWSSVSPHPSCDPLPPPPSFPLGGTTLLLLTTTWVVSVGVDTGSTFFGGRPEAPPFGSHHGKGRGRGEGTVVCLRPTNTQLKRDTETSGPLEWTDRLFQGYGVRRGQDPGTSDHKGCYRRSGLILRRRPS